MKDTSDVLASCVAIVADTLAVFAGFLLATWIRFDSGWIPLFHDTLPPQLYGMYAQGAGIAALMFLFIFQSLRLYVRPQIGTFGDKIPRLIHGIGLGLLLSLALAFALRTDPPFSRLTTLIAVATISLCVLLERYLLFRWELHLARHRTVVNRVLIVGTDSIAARLQQALRQEPRLGSRVVAFLRTRDAAPHPDIPPDLIRGTVDDLKPMVEAGAVDQVILTDASIGHPRMIDMILQCEQALVTFNVVPDLFRVLTDNVDMQTIDDIPLLGVSRWPLDHFWNRVLKRIADVAGAGAGLILLAPFLPVLALLIKRDSPGPVFYRQERCGENGRPFALIKFRTMRPDAETATGPVWTVENDPRRTRFGAFLRRYNLDELPQLWNVLQGEMSLVGPRPERPCFVEQFKEGITRYMWRHVSKPGITGWAQVNGLRGNTDLQERVKYDLYYLENWSLALDFKILVKTFFNRKNAY
ncbi:MAG: undecaprenyl-phosphate glucose phosphotransferase [Verrucomicrobia bacterium]|nr:undecaprenyl-phosphate glucose phosphotransferase [Verrucomicrobiota bacterium]MCG2681748.1 undecaprenyl-phosphate glucose phosphotransferase [Kiritimatiellia bacterium]MBU4247162.1 undecaprenyl-phosphate glucose phosphotransferase [Verrucomicrobiota bacterium]MBU4291066.1 undecaprenyl-phosphate glucose phosphotransferase [Verrucomicrobiota bacterium]MBU4429715.1 undecaprenyl-phosphate glucose phosphotransferase [Verrucomicrobiota bacterium]